MSHRHPMFDLSANYSTQERAAPMQGSNSVMPPSTSLSSSSSKKRKRIIPTEIIDLTVSPTPSPKKSSPQKSSLTKTPTKRQKKDPKERGALQSSPERRLKQYRHHPPQTVLVKQLRVMTQKMFLIERSGRKNATLAEDFSVLGSTGNIYVVNVSRIPRFPYLLSRRN
jgi:hypothetical protein